MSFSLLICLACTVCVIAEAGLTLYDIFPFLSALLVLSACARGAPASLALVPTLLYSLAYLAYPLGVCVCDS